MTAGGEPVRREIGLAAQLHDARRDLVGVTLLFVRMIEEFLRNALRVDAARHEVMTAVTQDAHELGRQRVVEELEDHFAVGGIPCRDGTLLDALAGTLA